MPISGSCPLVFVTRGPAFRMLLVQTHVVVACMQMPDWAAQTYSILASTSWHASLVQSLKIILCVRLDGFMLFVSGAISMVLHVDRTLIPHWSNAFPNGHSLGTTGQTVPCTPFQTCERMLNKSKWNDAGGWPCYPLGIPIGCTDRRAKCSPLRVLFISCRGRNSLFCLMVSGLRYFGLSHAGLDKCPLMNQCFGVAKLTSDCMFSARTFGGLMIHPVFVFTFCYPWFMSCSLCYSLVNRVWVWVWNDFCVYWHLVIWRACVKKFWNCVF